MNTHQIARLAQLIGEPARAAMMLALMDGRALTARELAQAARVAPATASRHLAQLVEAGLLTLARQGRHRYHRLASREVAQALEGLMQLTVQLAAQQGAPQAAQQAGKPSAPMAAQQGAHQAAYPAVHQAASPALHQAAATTTRPLRTGPKDEALRFARRCYDHVAGRLGVAITDRLLADGAIVFDEDAGQWTERLAGSLRGLGLAVEGDALASPGPGRPVCRPCLDWSERRPHVAGRLGALLCAHCLERGWLRRQDDSRALMLTPAGTLALREWLGARHWPGAAP